MNVQTTQYLKESEWFLVFSKNFRISKNFKVLSSIKNIYKICLVALLLFLMVFNTTWLKNFSCVDRRHHCKNALQLAEGYTNI